jgi:hypothetical protein
VGCQDGGDREQDRAGELTAGERAELHRLRRETVELRGEVQIQRQILRKVAAWFAQKMQEGGVDRPPEGWSSLGTAAHPSRLRHD